MMYGWDGWIMMTVLMVLFWAVVITAIVVGVRYVSAGSGSQAGDQPARSAEHVLADRFARGDIDEDEYRRRMTALREHR